MFTKVEIGCLMHCASKKLEHWFTLQSISEQGLIQSQQDNDVEQINSKRKEQQQVVLNIGASGARNATEDIACTNKETLATE